MKDKTEPFRVRARIFAYRKAPELPVQLTVTPEFLDLSEAPKGEVVIEWKLVTKGYRFPSDGTAIVFTSPGSKEAFSRTVVTRDGKCNDENVATVQLVARNGLAYAYTISVIDSSTGLTAVLDPGAQVPPH